MQTKTQVNKNTTRNRAGEQSGKQRKPASVESPRELSIRIDKYQSLPLVVEWENVSAEDYVNYALNVALKGSLEDMANIAGDSNPNEADRLRARTFLTRLNGPAKPPAPGGPAIVRRPEEALHGVAIKAMSRLIRAQERAGAVLLLTAAKFMAFAMNGEDATAEDYHISIGLRAAAKSGNDELQPLIIQAGEARARLDEHRPGASEHVHKCLFDCEFKCNEMAQLLELISHTWHEMAKARMNDHGILFGEWARMVAEQRATPEQALAIRKQQAEVNRKAASKFSLIIVGAADELRDAWDAAWQAWVAVREPAPALKEAA